jgi:hypothetical protein
VTIAKIDIYAQGNHTVITTDQWAMTITLLDVREIGSLKLSWETLYATSTLPTNLAYNLNIAKKRNSTNKLASVPVDLGK